MSRSYQYNRRLQPTDIRDTQQGQANYLLDLNFYWGDNGTETLNNNGNLRGEGINTDNGPTLSTQINSWLPFSYDGVNRLATMSDSASGTSQQFAYDAYGNRTIGVNGAAPPAPSSAYNAGTNRSNLLTYDAAGNQLSSNYQLLTYDAEERISQAYDNVSGDTMTFAYDGDGKRVSKTAGGNTTVYVYDAFGSLAAEYHSWRGYAAKCATCYLSLDHLGSTRMVTDQNGELISRHDYYPLGDEIPAVGGRTSVWGASDEVKQMFTGKERDGETGLDYFGARYYGSAVGRWASPDPSNLGVDFYLPQTWNRYNYAVNNPLSIADRNGLWPFYIHNEIIGESFPGLSKQNIETLQDASRKMEFGPGQQDPAGSFEHGMSDGTTNQDPMAAQTMGDDFISQQVQAAQQAQADWAASGQTGISPVALTAFGNALHTATDRTSLSHRGNQPWHNDPWYNKRTRTHIENESTINAGQMAAAKRAAQDLFRRTFGSQFSLIQVPEKELKACVTAGGVTSCDR